MSEQKQQSYQLAQEDVAKLHSLAEKMGDTGKQLCDILSKSGPLNAHEFAVTLDTTIQNAADTVRKAAVVRDSMWDFIQILPETMDVIRQEKANEVWRQKLEEQKPDRKNELEESKSQAERCLFHPLSVGGALLGFILITFGLWETCDLVGGVEGLSEVLARHLNITLMLSVGLLLLMAAGIAFAKVNTAVSKEDQDEQRNNSGSPALCI